MARQADKSRDTMLVPKTARETPPLEIHTLGDEGLRQPARRIGKVNEQVRELARDMLRSMYTAKGIGLAAPQVGLKLRILVYNETGDPEQKDKEVVLEAVKQNGKAVEYADPELQRDEDVVSTCTR